jgi:phenol 2-monooxygenase
LLAGRADGVQARALELLHSWGLAQEVHEEGPILNSTALFKDGAKLFYNWSSQCDSRYKGIHIITQGQMERIYIRDLLRHKVLVERCTVVDGFEVGDESLSSHPVKATLKNLKTGQRELIRAKYLVGGDGAASSIREQLKIPFDGNTTDIYWAIMDCVFKTDYPHILDFRYKKRRILVYFD